MSGPTEGSATVGDLRVAWLEVGPADGPLAVVVHGFPDSPRSWTGVLDALAADGFRAVAPFARGYAPTAVPDDPVVPTGRLALDVAGLVEHLLPDAAEPAVLVGHDWGAPAVYGAAGLLGDRVRAVVGMSVPPGVRLRDMTSYDQARRSFYYWLFQLPAAEKAVAADDFAFLDRIWDDWTAPGTESAAARTAVKDCLREPAALTTALGYYRALTRRPAGTPPPGFEAAQAASRRAPEQPFRYLHGEQDGCLGVTLSDGVPGRRVVAGANHFLHLDRPAEVVEELRAFLSGPDQSRLPAGRGPSPDGVD